MKYTEQEMKYNRQFVEYMLEQKAIYIGLGIGVSEMMHLVKQVVRASMYKQFPFRSMQYNVHYGHYCRAICAMRDLIYTKSCAKRQLSLLEESNEKR